MNLITISHEEVHRGTFLGTWGLVQDPEDGSLKKLFVAGFKLSHPEFEKVLAGGFEGGEVKEITNATEVR